MEQAGRRPSVWKQCFWYPNAALDDVEQDCTCFSDVRIRTYLACIDLNTDPLGVHVVYMDADATHAFCCKAGAILLCGYVKVRCTFRLRLLGQLNELIWCDAR
jgi:hypothetical protein